MGLYVPGRSTAVGCTGIILQSIYFRCRKTFRLTQTTSVASFNKIHQLRLNTPAMLSSAQTVKSLVGICLSELHCSLLPGPHMLARHPLNRCLPTSVFLESISCPWQLYYHPKPNQQASIIQWRQVSVGYFGGWGGDDLGAARAAIRQSFWDVRRLILDDPQRIYHYITRYGMRHFCIGRCLLGVVEQQSKWLDSSHDTLVCILSKRKITFS